MWEDFLDLELSNSLWKESLHIAGLHCIHCSEYSDDYFDDYFYATGIVDARFVSYAPREL